MEEVKNTQIKIFEERQVRTIWDKEKEEWYFSVVDVIAVLTDSPNPRNYWKVLKHRLLEDEGSQVVTNCNHIQNAVDGATIAKNARTELEKKTGKKVISPSNALSNDRLIETKASVFDEDEESK